MSQWFQSQAAAFYVTGYESLSHGMTNVSITEVNILKNNSTSAVFVPTNLSINLGFVDPRWSRGYHTLHGIRGSRVQTRPGRWIFSERKNPDYGFIRKGSNAVGPVS